LGELCRYLNGKLYTYQEVGFETQLYYDIKYELTKIMSWESVFRVRVTKGFKLTNIHGNYSIRQNDLLTFPTDE